MLILTRRIDEEIVIDLGERIVTVMVTDLRHGKVKLGVSADRDIKVHRREVYDAIQRASEGDAA